MPSKKKGKKKKGKKAKEVVTYGMWLDGVLKDQEKEREKDPEGPKTPNNDEFLLRLMNTDNSKGQEIRDWMLTRGPDDDTFERVDIHKTLDKKAVLLYFASSSAHEVDGNDVTPELVKLFNIAKTIGKHFEIVLVPLDRKEDVFLPFVENLPWYTLPLGDVGIKRLVKQYKLVNFPALVVHDQFGKLITTDGIDRMFREPSKFPFAKANTADPIRQAMRRPNAYPCTVDDCKCNKFSQPGGAQWVTIQQRVAPAARNVTAERCNNCGHGDIYHVPSAGDGKKKKNRR